MKKKHPIRQHQKRDKISHDIKIPLPPKMGFPEGDEINLTIIAYPDDWIKLTRYSPDDDDDMKYLWKLISLHGIYPVFEEKIKHSGTPAARGIHAVSSGGQEDD